MNTKISFLIVLMHGFIGVVAQDTTFFDLNDKKVAGFNECEYYKLVRFFEGGGSNVKYYYKSGQLNIEKNYSDYENRIMHKKHREWYENGQIHKDIDYDLGRLHGSVLTYWENGTPERIDFFQQDSLITGKCFGKDGKDTAYVDFFVMPKYVGGDDARLRYLKDKVTYPKKSKRKGIEGKVFVSFIVDEQGVIKDAYVYRGVVEDIDAEALRVVRLMPKWTPGFSEGIPVKVKFILPIKFSLY
jgi:protein TonB